MTRSNLAPKRTSIHHLYRESRLEVSRRRVVGRDCGGRGTGNGVGVGGGAGCRGGRSSGGVVLQELAGRVEVQVVGKIL